MTEDEIRAAAAEPDEEPTEHTEAAPPCEPVPAGEQD